MHDRHSLLPSPLPPSLPSLPASTLSGSYIPPNNRTAAAPARRDGINHQVLVLDVSSSMNGTCEGQLTKLDVLKRATISLLGVQCRQSTGAQITLVVFDHSAKVVADEIADPTGHPRLVQAVKSFTSGGGTDITEALQVGGGCFDSNHFGLKQLTLLSDGGHVGGGDPRQAAADLKLKGISIAAIGFGDDADEPLLRDIASQSKGAPAYWHARDQQSLSNSLRNATL